MEVKVKNREWVKNAAIIFLAVLLVLTFFSNTWMNRSLPEVATQSVTSGSITARVRGTGTVAANGSHQVKATENREIRAVMVKAGQEVSTGDVLFVLGQGEASELEQAQEQLRSLQVSYQRAAAGSSGGGNYAADELRIKAAKEDMERSGAKLRALEEKAQEDLPTAQRDAAQQLVDSKQEALDAATDTLTEKQEALDEAQSILESYQSTYDSMYSSALYDVSQKEADAPAAEALYNAAAERYNSDPSAENLEAMEAAKAAWDAAEDAILSAKAYMDNLETTEIHSKLEAQKSAVTTAQADVDAAQADAETLQAELNAAAEDLGHWQDIIDQILAAGPDSDDYIAAKEAYSDDCIYYQDLVASLESKRAADARSAAQTGIELMDIAQQIEKAKAKVESLSGGDDNMITAKVSGTVQSISCTSGDTKLKGDILCTIEVPDMGHTLSISVTNEQARRLRVGDVGSVSNYYWGSQITCTLTSIQVDPKNPQNNKLLTFDVDGDVSTGQEITVSVGQKSASYDVIIPNSAIRSDSNGSFVLAVESRNSPLGNRYVARRVSVEVLAADDANSAVTADLGYGDFVITTSSAPVKNGELVRLADA